MGNKHDERENEIQKIKKDIENAQYNVEFTNEMIDSISDHEVKAMLEEQNERRLEAIDLMVNDVNSRIKD